jgi:hypothetical protein
MIFRTILFAKRGILMAPIGNTDGAIAWEAKTEPQTLCDPNYSIGVGTNNTRAKPAQAHRIKRGGDKPDGVKNNASARAAPPEE